MSFCVLLAVIHMSSVCFWCLCLLLQAAHILGSELSVCHLCTEGSHSHVLEVCSDVCTCCAVLKAAQIMSCECSVGRLFTVGTRSCVVVIVFDVCACLSCRLRREPSVCRLCTEGSHLIQS